MIALEGLLQPALARVGVDVAVSDLDSNCTGRKENRSPKDSSDVCDMFKRVTVSF